MGQATLKCDCPSKIQYILQYMETEERDRKGWQNKYFFTLLSVLVSSEMSSLVAKAEDWDYEDFRISRGLETHEFMHKYHLDL